MSILLLVSQSWLNIWKGALLFRSPPWSIPSRLFSFLSWRATTAAYSHTPLDQNISLRMAWISVRTHYQAEYQTMKNWGFSPLPRDRFKMLPRSDLHVCFSIALQSSANHNSTNSHIWMLFHLVLPAVTVITFQGSLAGKVKWHDTKRIRLKQIFNSKCQIYRNVLWICTKWDCRSLSSN